MRIEYDGKYPTLCSGELIVWIGETKWEFPICNMLSGGSISVDDEWNEVVIEGDWSIYAWPKNFPEDMKTAVIKEINDKIKKGCCGGCLWES